MEYPDLEARAFRAYFRRFGPNCDQPGSGVETHEDDGVTYVTLSNARGTLATFEIVDADDDYKLKYVA